MGETSRGRKNLDLKIVGPTAFGRYPKISTEQTFNMFESDGWLIPYAGYRKVNTQSLGNIGRGLYSSIEYKNMIAVIDNNVYSVDKNINETLISKIDTSNGDVFIAENNAGQIGICDKKNIYIFDYRNETFEKADTSGFLPGYLSFQDTRFITVNLAPQKGGGQWRLSSENNGLEWPNSPTKPYVGLFQTKADNPVAAVRMPGRGGLLMVMGNSVTEPWTDVGQDLFPYLRSTTFNLDYGCLNPATIAALDNYMVWLGGNEQAGPTIMYTDGGAITQISTDGINYRLANISKPQNSYGFLFRQDGNLFYQITFYSDNISYTYNFNTKKFYTVTDENLNYHIAKKVVFFNNSYYFVSINDGNIYDFNSKYTTLDGKDAPRIRICPNIRLPDSSRFVANTATFTMEQGEYSDINAIDMSISVNGGQSYSNFVRQEVRRLPLRKNRITYFNMGLANDFVAQFRFYGHGRFVATDGVLGIYQ